MQELKEAMSTPSPVIKTAKVEVNAIVRSFNVEFAENGFTVRVCYENVGDEYIDSDEYVFESKSTAKAFIDSLLDED